MGRWSRLAGDSFLDWLDPAKALRWLDVGCGNGAFTEALIARCAPAAVTAIDPSEGQLAFARVRPGASKALFSIGRAEALLRILSAAEASAPGPTIAAARPQLRCGRNGSCAQPSSGSRPGRRGNGPHCPTWRYRCDLYVGYPGRRSRRLRQSKPTPSVFLSFIPASRTFGRPTTFRLGRRATRCTPC